MAAQPVCLCYVYVYVNYCDYLKFDKTITSLLGQRLCTHNSLNFKCRNSSRCLLAQQRKLYANYRIQVKINFLFLTLRVRLAARVRPCSSTTCQQRLTTLGSSRTLLLYLLCPMMCSFLRQPFILNIKFSLFQPYGTVVEGKVVRDPATNANKGFGFIHMSTIQECYAAITALNGAQVHGRTLQVSLKKDK